MRKKEYQDCWEFFKCKDKVKNSCPAYQTNSGRECWMLAADFCKKHNGKYASCRECSWFKKLNPDI